MNFKIINGNSYEELKKFPDNYFDSVVTDPPYGLGKEPDATEMLKAWVEIGYMEVKGGGFMGKEWDSFVPQPLFWKEVFRVLKHGGHIVAFYGTRTYDWGVMAMRLAGFEIRDSIQWCYGSGFPKSHNISKAIDKMYGAEREVIGKSKYTIPKADNTMGENSYGISGGKLANGTTAERVVADITNPSTEEAKQWDGWGSALKPAVEPIVLARKPLEKGLSIAENVLKWGTGGINIDGCRVGNQKRTTPIASGDKKEDTTIFNLNTDVHRERIETNQGRFPSNFIMSHHPDCEFKGLKKVKSNGNFPSQQNTSSVMMSSMGKSLSPENSHSNEKGEEETEDWSCHENCPVKILDEQSGESKSSDTKRNRNTIGSFGMPNDNTPEYSDKGGASRFFYVAKASKSERNFGLDGFNEKRPDSRDSKGMGVFEEKGVGIQKNFHPTVKPIKLMQYLVRLITPPNGKILDPFNGSGTTGIASLLEGFDYTGIELDSEYCKIAEARISAWNEIEEYEHYKKIIENQEEEKENSKIGGVQTNLFED
jgi:site-specific DNA-methyltransferase (adenine-specific)